MKSANEWEIYVHIRKDINITGFDEIEGEGGRERNKFFFCPFKHILYIKKNLISTHVEIHISMYAPIDSKRQ